MNTAQDTARVEAIAEYRIVEAEPEASLESLARLAATLCAVPTAVVNIIDDRWQHQVAAYGCETSICTREDSMCAVILQDARHVLVIDAQQDQRFATNPFVSGELGNIRFYASSPLITPAGVTIGTLCVFADEPGDLSPEQSAALDMLALQAVEVLELRRITHELGRSNEQLTHFAGQVSHDLRNPLTVLIGNIELAADGVDAGDPSRTARALGFAAAAATRMNGMITDLLAYARIGGGAAQHSEVSLRAVVSDALGDLEASITAAGATVIVDVPEDDDVVAGDATLLSVLMQNLIANAVKFAAVDGGRPLIEVAAEHSEAGWVLTVDDNGPGVPAEERERVFGVMERGSAHDVPGLGLGLTTCRQIVRAHDGRISIEDSALGGARVRVTLPSHAQPSPAIAQG